MEMIPHDELNKSQTFNFAPMIDFLFLMLALFATLAMSRAALSDTEIELAKINVASQANTSKAQIHSINLSIDAEGKYKWLTEFQEYPMASTSAIQDELIRQYALHALPQDKAQTEILLHIDKKAPWEPIAQAIFSIRELGFNARPVYENAPLKN
jgi:biopolymer transport protein ExbD